MCICRFGKRFLETEREKEIEVAAKKKRIHTVAFSYFLFYSRKYRAKNVTYREVNGEKMILERFEHAQQKRSASILESDGKRKKN